MSEDKIVNLADYIPEDVDNSTSMILRWMLGESEDGKLFGFTGLVMFEDEDGEPVCAMITSELDDLKPFHALGGLEVLKNNIIAKMNNK